MKWFLQPVSVEKPENDLPLIKCCISQFITSINFVLIQGIVDVPHADLE